jgi:hypothetical protein
MKRWWTVREIMDLMGVTKAAVYRRIYGVQTGRHGIRAAPRPPWMDEGAVFRAGRWQVPSRLVRAWLRDRQAT